MCVCRRFHALIWDREHQYRLVLQSMHMCVCVCVTSWRMVCPTEKARGVFLVQMTSQAAQSLSATLCPRRHTMGKKTTNDVVFSVQKVCLYLHPILCVDVCTCRFLEEYLDSKRPLSPVSPLSDGPESTKPPSKTKTSEQHDVHVHKNRDKNRDSSIKVIQKKCQFRSSQLQCLQLFFNCLFHRFFTCTAKGGGGKRKSVKTSPTTIRVLGPSGTQRRRAKP